MALNKIATLSYVVVTSLLFDLLKSVNRTAALLWLLIKGVDMRYWTATERAR